MKVALIAGARPNFMKIAPLVWAMKKRADVTSLVIHTGQHFDDDMSRVFFEQLELPDPDVNLNVGPASHAAQTARVMAALEPVLIRQRPDWVAVVGDVNSTLAGALVAAKLGLPLCHVEAGLRSGDRSMPEEINRLATDAIADLLFATSRDAVDHLRREGHPEQQIVFAGNVMVDTLRHVLPRLEPGHARQHLGLAGGYILVTLHRPSNVDRVETLAALAGMLAELAGTLPVVFPVHPRTRSSLDVIWPPGELPAGLHLMGPVGYTDFLALERDARLVLTDSGGIQEETTVLGVPCLTLRTTTERPVTVSQGTNTVVGTDPGRVLRAARRALEQPPSPGVIPERWDGQASERIIDALLHAATRLAASRPPLPLPEALARTGGPCKP